ncbi:MAG: hypothetical protein VX910_12995, partial [Candidatus Latescibacterota bacterium]|nr:hypothetical protein [Candidatus Latescibacterota bacterium]
MGAHTLTTPNHHKESGPSADRIREGVLSRLIQVRNRQTTFRVILGLSTILSAAIVFAVSLIAVESVSYLSPASKIPALSLLCLALVLSAIWWIARPVFSPPGLQVIARNIEESRGGLHQHLTNVLQLWDLRDRPGASRDLIEAAVKQAAQETATIDFTRSVNTTPAIRSLRRLTLSLVVGIFILQLLPGGLVAALNRLANPTQFYTRPQETHLLATPGDTILIVGDSLALSTNIDGVVPLTAALLTQAEGQSAWSSSDISIRENRATHRISNIRESFFYRWKAHDAKSGLYQVHVKPRPVVLSVTSVYRYPAYTGLGERVDTEVGDIVALKGTEVTLQIRSSRDLKSARLAFENGVTLPADISRDSAEVS